MRDAAVASALVMSALAPLRAQTVDPRGVYRVFLTDGRALPSYGEPTTLAGRIAFVLVIGDPRAKSELQLISLPASAVDVRRTERYTEFLRAQQYAVTGGPTDYSAFAAEMTVTLADIEKQPDPRRRLDLALEARRRIAGWPAAHRFYRVNDVRTMLRGLDTIVADLARSAGGVAPPSPIIGDPPRYEPEVPLPGARDWVELSVAAAAATGDNDTRATILRNALSVAGAGEAASPIRAELARATGQAPAAAAAPRAAAPPPAAPPPVSARASAKQAPPAKASADRVTPPRLIPSPPAVKASPAPMKPAPPAAPPLKTAARVEAAPVKPVPTPEPAPVKVIEAPKPKVEAPKVEPAPAAPVVPAPVLPAPISSAPAAAPIVAAPAAASNPRSALTAVAISVVVLAAAGLAFRALRRRPAGQAVGTPAAVVAPERVAPEPQPQPPPLPVPVPQPPPALAPPPTPVPPPAPLPLPVPVPVSDGPQGLELVSVREARFYGYRFVEGEVKNVSNRVLENLEVAVRWYVRQGALLATDAAVFDAGALPAGRTAPFRVLTRSTPGMASYSLHFRSKGDLVAQFQPPGLP